MTPAAAPKGVAVLGSTGSIGTTALRVLDRQRQRFRVMALTANSNGALLREQALKFSPAFVGMVEPQSDGDDAWKSGTDALIAAATRDDVDIVLNAIVGVAGLDATLAALASRGSTLRSPHSKAASASRSPTRRRSSLRETWCGRPAHPDRARSFPWTASTARSFSASRVIRRRRCVVSCSPRRVDHSAAGARSGSRRQLWMTLSGTRPGKWAARSRSTAQRLRTRHWK